MKKLSKADAHFMGEVEPDTLYGPKRSSHIVLLILFVFILVAITWAKFSMIDEVTSGQGNVIPSREIQKIQNLEGGIVKKLLVKEGDVVKKGQPLILIDDIRFSSSYKENLVKAEGLEIRYLRLKANFKKTPFKISEALAKKHPETYIFENALFQSRKKELEHLNHNHQLALKELKMTIPLIRKGAASPVEVLRLKRATSELEGKVIAFHSKTLDELNKVKAEWVGLRAANTANKDRLARTVVRSPVRGIVKQINVNTVGGIVQPAMDIMEIVPLDDTLLVEAKIPPKDIGFLSPGLKATVNITAYDYAVYGSLEGTLEQISADAITDDQSKETYYLIKIRTTKNYLGTKAEPLYIIPGMVATVDILTGKKSILNYILNPITAGVKRSLREK